MADTEKSIPLAISLPETLIAELDRVVADVKESRSAVMRKAIRAGLPLVKSGGGADVITLDSEFSADVDKASKETELARNRILLEAIRAGLHAFISRVMSEKVSLAELQDPKDRDDILRDVEKSYKLYDDPMVREHRKLIWERGNATTRLMDILQHVPEAQRRNDAVNRLTEIRRRPGGGGGGAAWMSGLSTDEMEWQIQMAEKHGPNAADWPPEEKLAHYEKKYPAGDAVLKSLREEIKKAASAKKSRK